MPRMKITPVHFHTVEDRGKFRVHRYGDPGDYFEIATGAEVQTLKKFVPVFPIDEGEDCPMCDANYDEGR